MGSSPSKNFDSYGYPTDYNLWNEKVATIHLLDSSFYNSYIHDISNFRDPTDIVTGYQS